MAFSFGGTAPAPASGGFSFGGSGSGGAATTTTSALSSFGGGGGLFGTPAPAGSYPSGGLFGSSNAAPAPAGGGGLFGSTPAPAFGGSGSLFGSSTSTTPAPAGGGGLFGSTAPASTGLFGSAPAPAIGGLFGSTSAPSAGGLFGSTPAPATGSLFGTAALAPAPGSGLFGTSGVVPSMQQQQQQHFSGNTPYAQLPEHAKKAIDQIYQLMMQHRRTLASVKTMAPALLREDAGNLSPADAAAGSPSRRPVTSTRASFRKSTTDPSNEPLPRQMVSLQTQIQTLLQSAETNLTEARQLKTVAGEAVAQAKMHGAWPIENVAARRGVALTSIKGLLKEYAHANAQASAFSAGASVGGTPASSLNLSGMRNIDAIALQQIMDIRAARVDRIEPMPSPYLWEVLSNFEQRVAMAQREVDAIRTRLTIAEESESAQTMSTNTSLLLTNAGSDLNMMATLMLNAGKGSAFELDAAPLSMRLVALARSQNEYFLRIAAQAARAHEGLEEMKVRFQRYCQTTKGGYYQDPFLTADVEEFSREREMQQRIMLEQLATAAPSTAATAAAIGTMAPPPAPSASSAGFFSQPAPAPAMRGLFGSPAPAPTTGGLFGAPASGLFGATGTPAPAPSGGGFGLSAPAPATGGSLFGGTPAPATTAGGGLFGSSTLTPTTPASTLAPRKKSATRSGARRR